MKLGTALYRLIDPKTQEEIAASNSKYFIEELQKLWLNAGKHYKIIYKHQEDENESSRFNPRTPENSRRQKPPDPCGDNDHGRSKSAM